VSESVRDRIRRTQRTLRDGSLTPSVVRECLMELTALTGNVAEEQREADYAFKLILLAALQTHSKANRARIEAETSPEYVRAREAKDTADLVTELMRSCRTYLRSLDTEMELAR
jgi:uncharacterized NAD(P)/FAD-binding protein YdhS